MGQLTLRAFNFHPKTNCVYFEFFTIDMYCVSADKSEELNRYLLYLLSSVNYDVEAKLEDIINFIKFLEEQKENYKRIYGRDYW